jgi:ParB-like chromosome segregation protein Spo0J
LEFGFTNPILVDSMDGIIAGHGRLLAARKLGLAEVPVVVLDHLSETQRRAYSSVFLSAKDHYTCSRPIQARL